MLTKDQQVAETKFFNFLLSDASTFRIYGEGGTGKSFLVKHLINKTFASYINSCELLKIKSHIKDIHLTATTNKAAALLNDYTNEDVSTIYSLFDAVVNPDYKTGKMYLKFSSDKRIENALIFVDECSLLNDYDLAMLKRRAKNCKWVFIGDRYQLPPVQGTSSLDFPESDCVAVLTTQMRNRGQVDLKEMCSSIRNCVDTGNCPKLPNESENIKFINDDQLKTLLDSWDSKEFKVLSYTNERALQYIKYIEGSNHEEQLNYLNNNYVRLSHRDSLYPDQQFTLVRKGSPTTLYYGDGNDFLEVYYCNLLSSTGKLYNSVCVAKDSASLQSVLKSLAKRKQWHSYYRLKETVVDLRSATALTVHKSQGSSYNNVIIDLDSFKSCSSISQLTRLLYVAVSRARNKVYFYGRDSRLN